MPAWLSSKWKRKVRFLTLLLGNLNRDQEKLKANTCTVSQPMKIGYLMWASMFSCHLRSTELSISTLNSMNKCRDVRPTVRECTHGRTSLYSSQFECSLHRRRRANKCSSNSSDGRATSWDRWGKEKARRGRHSSPSSYCNCNLGALIYLLHY